MTEDELREVAGRLTKAQREAILGAYYVRTGERWTLRACRTVTINALVRMGLAFAWGMASADLTPAGQQVRDFLRTQESSND